MTIPYNAAKANVLTWKTLQKATYQFNPHASAIELADGQFLDVERIVRLVPKRRAVVFAHWRGLAVVAKLFFDAQHAKRHMEAEVRGIALLRDSKIPTPTLITQTQSGDRRIYILVLERIDGRGLADMWAERNRYPDMQTILENVTIELATQHVLGVVQNDLHLNNFLLTEKIIYSLDGATIRQSPNLLTKKPSMENLALFLAQLGTGVGALQEHLFKHYAQARGWLIKADDIKTIFALINRWNKNRWLSFEKKIFRNSTQFARVHDFTTQGIYDRAYSNEAFLAFLRQPESAFNAKSSMILKAGRSCTVIKARIGDREMVVKRYNIKNLTHRARRMFRASRAVMCWRTAQKLRLFGVNTARPIAYIEKQKLGFKLACYFVMEYIPGDHALQYFEDNQQDHQKSKQMIQRIAHLLKSFYETEISHGDLKITNLLVDKNDEPVIIDLDGAKEHSTIASLRLAWRKDRKRFLRNFAAWPSLHKSFESNLF